MKQGRTAQSGNVQAEGNHFHSLRVHCRRSLRRCAVHSFEFLFAIHWFQLRLVALNEPLTGDMGGIQRVDYACFRQARQAGLKVTMNHDCNQIIHSFQFYFNVETSH